MARVPRSKILSKDVPGIYHVYSRTVRQTFLFGKDGVTGRDYGHRQEMLRNAVRTLARIFAIDVLGCGFMGNHFHEILRNRPDLVRKMSDYQVALRICLLNELGMNLNVASRRRTPRQLARLHCQVQFVLSHPAKLAKAREDLSNISCYEQRLKGMIARVANREDGVTGHFWEGRFGSNPITDAAQLLTVMTYIDLNPIRAGIAETPEGSRYTSAYERIQGLCARLETSGDGESADAWFTPEQREAIARVADDQDVRAVLDNWLSPIDERREVTSDCETDWLEPLVAPGYELWQSDLATAAPERANENSEQPQLEPSFADLPDITDLPARASNKGCLPMTVCEYLQILDWTGRQFRKDKKGAIPQKLRPILERLGITKAKSWFAQLAAYGAKLKRAFSAPVNQLAEAARCVVETIRGPATIPDALF